ncbi:sensor domain-containing diguanylate cyclase [Thermotoga sp. SG1]|uniref:sensor domain-containing diguanylate cyclase n=1 Tax=Thermotoga sp. SG1 TaxID=126739 RepID=UPI000C756429|nr:sensor domain-containing diguanylate cyclase [Thermotoga sp. SG1]PLV56192.1 diguanylate cyclase [Thermotoga sp. SG1]
MYVLLFSSLAVLAFSIFLFFLAVKRTKDYSQLEKRFNIIVEGLSKLDPDMLEEAFFQAILDIAMSVVPEATKGSVSRITDEGDWIFVSSRGHTMDLYGKRFPARYLFRAGKEPVEVNFLEYDKDLLPDDMWKFFEKTLRGTRKSLVVGLFAGDEFLGNIALDSPHSQFSDLSKKTLKLLGNLASTYLLLKRSLEKEHRFQKIMGTILTLLLLFRKQISVEDFLKESLQKMIEASEIFSGGAVFKENVIVFSIGLERTELNFKKTTERIEEFQIENTHYVSIQLKGEGFPLYRLVFVSKTKIPPFIFGVLNTFAEVIFLYLREYQLHKKYQEMAMRDSLTGAYTRHYFNEWIFSHMAWLRRNQKKSILVILDVDGLKMINDTYGHLMGDRALKEFVKILKDTVRESDLVFRYGGDEFLLVLTESSQENVHPVLERLKENLKRLDLPFELSFSFGYEEIDGFIPIERALGKADDLLYKNKFKKRGVKE